MPRILEAACRSEISSKRKNNEDNVFFLGYVLPEVNSGTEKVMHHQEVLDDRQMFLGVFDGMGGECFGESASFAAASSLSDELALPDRSMDGEEVLELCYKMNTAVNKRKEELKASHMGSTFALIVLNKKELYAMNIGDSRIYRVRNGRLLRISEDHISREIPTGYVKAPLVQNLGVDSSEMILDPCIVHGDVRNGDAYLICTDGLTDVVDDVTILSVMTQSSSAAECVDELINQAVKDGGVDNTTAIVLMIRDYEES